MRTLTAATAIAVVALGACQSPWLEFEPITGYTRALCDDSAVALRSNADGEIRRAFDKIVSAAARDLRQYTDVDIVVVRGHRLTSAGVCHSAASGRATVLLTEEFVRAAWTRFEVERFAAYYVGHEIGHLVLGHTARKTPPDQAEREAYALGAYYLGRSGFRCAWLAEQIGVTIIDDEYPAEAHKAAVVRHCGGAPPEAYLQLAAARR